MIITKPPEFSLKVYSQGDGNLDFGLVLTEILDYN